MLPRRTAVWWPALAAGLWVLSASPVLAHAPSDPDAKIFYVGAFEIIRHPTFCLSILCLGLWAGQRNDRRAGQVGVLFVLSLVTGIVLAAASVTVPGASMGPMIAMALFGAALALRFSDPWWVAATAVLALGWSYGNECAQGLSGTAGQKIGYALGVTAVTAVIILYAGMLMQRLRWFAAQIGVRVLGSWVAAAGLLLLALRFRPATP